MLGRKLWYIVTLVTFALLPLAGCGGGAGTSTVSKAGYTVTAAGKVATSSAQSAIAAAIKSAADLGTVTIINAQDGTTLGSGTIDSTGAFSNIALTLTNAKTILVFKAVIAQGTFHTIVPLDLSNPPAAGLTSNNTLNITISQDTENIATTVSAMLGVTGILGDTGATLNAVSKTYTDAATQVTNNGGQAYAYNTSGLSVVGSLASASLLPARDASTLTYDDLNNVKLDAKIISAFIPNNHAIINFQVTNKATGKGITGLRTFSLHIAKLVAEANGSSSYWQNYIASGLPGSARFFSYVATYTPSAASNPSSDAADTYSNGVKVADGYKIIDHGDGTYTATMAVDVTKNTNVAYDSAAVHRIGISVRSIAIPGVTAAGPINPQTNAVVTNFAATSVTAPTYDFVPATGTQYTNPNGGNSARDIVTMAACNQCHYVLGTIGGHFASRPDTKLCVMCHTSQLAGGEGEFVTFIHRIHMGETFNDTNSSWTVPAKGLVTYGEQTYPQDIRNCSFCHQGKDSDNWKTKANGKSCGSCHNAMNFTNGSHMGQSTDASCGNCHAGATAPAEVSAKHLAVQNPDPNAPELGGTNTHTYAGYLPAAGAAVPGASSINWVISEVGRDANNNPYMKFKFTKDGSDVVFNTYAAGSVTEMMDGFTGAPSAYFVFSVPQDNSTAPADYNASASAWIKGVWNGSVAASTATLSGPTSGYYTLTIKNKTVPDNAVMLTGGIGYTYGSASTPLTQTNLTAYPYNAATNVGGLMTVVPNVWKVATKGAPTGVTYAARRTIVSNAKCNACHAKLGIAPTFHSGQRNDAPTCSFCHNVNRVNSGWGVNIKEAVHAIHGASKRTVKFSWEATAGDKYWNTTYPGLLKNCEQCHVAGTYDFSASAYSTTLLSNLLYTTVATGNISASAYSIVTGNETVAATDSVISPYITAGASYGSGFSVASSGVATQAAATTLVSSPISSACFACHDTNAAKAHMTQFGGSIYEARSTALSKSETCLVCHGTAQNSLNTTVPTIKAVHRWW